MLKRIFGKELYAFFYRNQGFESLDEERRSIQGSLEKMGLLKSSFEEASQKGSIIVMDLHLFEYFIAALVLKYNKSDIIVERSQVGEGPSVWSGPFINR